MPTGLPEVVPGRVELPTSTLSVWRSNQLSYRTVVGALGLLKFPLLHYHGPELQYKEQAISACLYCLFFLENSSCVMTSVTLQKGGVPAAPSGTATLLRLSPNYQLHPRPLLSLADFRCHRLSWLDGRCVQGPGTYSPRHG